MTIRLHISSKFSPSFISHSIFLFLIFYTGFASENVGLNKTELREKAHEMFMHGFRNYMENAFPHDELMPLSCRGRQRGVSPSRGDVDDALGNFSLTLVDTLDTLVVLGEFDEFEKAAKLAVEHIRFDSDFVVSVFETNIRMVGGLISAHLMGLLVKQMEGKPRMVWYSDQLLKMASELADRLLPAFNSTSGVPHSMVNLKRGLSPNLKRQHDTCTACGGTMILEWAALSRLTGNPIYEEKARRAMDFLWNQRHRGSDLMGTVLNVNSGDWVRRDSGIGAGIDSYYEYTLKAYILLGEEDYLYRFNKHYEAVMRYLNKGPVFIDVQMHKPQIASRSFMDALLAFWPGLQVLKGDLRGAIEMHQMLYNVVKKHKFLPDAFTHDLQVHWAQHPLRPEFIESTYFLYRATKDAHYLEVAKEVMDSLEQNVRVPCGFASVKDVRTMEHEDQMESFVLAETFKYLFMIFAEPHELPFHPDNYVLTTEAHFLPLTIGEMAGNNEERLPRRMIIDPDEIIEQKEDGSAERRKFASACPNLMPDENDEEMEEQFPKAIPFSERTPDRLAFYGSHLREGVNKMLGTIDQFMAGKREEGGTCSAPQGDDPNRLRAWNFNPANPEHLEQLRLLGIRVEMQEDGRVQLTHSPENGPPVSITITSDACPSMESILSAFSIPTKALHTPELQRSKAELLHFTGMAKNVENAFYGLQFIREMTKFLNEQAAAEMPMAQMDRVVQIVSFPHLGHSQFVGAPAQFGMKFDGQNFGITGEIGLMDPLRACSPVQNAEELEGRIAIAQRGHCMFEEKARFAQEAGAIGLIVIDNQPGTSIDTSPLFAMSAANPGGTNADEKINIPAVFLFHKEAQQLLDKIFADPKMLIRLGENALSQEYCIEQFFLQNPSFQRQQFQISNQFLTIDAQKSMLKLNFYFGEIDEKSPPEEKQAVVERNLDWLANSLQFPNSKLKFAFIGHARALAYSLLGFPQQMSENNFIELRHLIGELRLKSTFAEEEQNLLSLPPSKGDRKSRSIICKFRDPQNQFSCSELNSSVVNRHLEA